MENKLEADCKKVAEYHGYNFGKLDEEVSILMVGVRDTGVVAFIDKEGQRKIIVTTTKILNKILDS